MILPSELLALIEQGETHTVEFKKSTADITKDTYETVCSFSNRDGGHIFLGVKDNGTIIGIQPDCVDQMKKDFVTTINNGNKMYPPLYLIPIEYEWEAKTIP
ncbi:RNA-binding domain-containing protein [Lachnospiraceae bacterium 56-18]